MQFARPTGQAGTNGQWRDQAAGTTAMHLAVDEAVLSTADYATCPGPGVGGDFTDYWVEFDMAGGTDPAVQTGHAIKLYALKALSIPTVQIRVELYNSIGNLIYTSLTTDLTDTNVLYTFALSSAEVTAFRSGGGYSGGVNLRIVRDGDPDVDVEPRVYQTWIEYPDAGFAHLDIDTAGLKVVAANSGHHLVLDGAGYRRVVGLEGPGALILNGSGQIVVSP